MTNMHVVVVDSEPTPEMVRSAGPRQGFLCGSTLFVVGRLLDVPSRPDKMLAYVCPCCCARKTKAGRRAVLHMFPAGGASVGRFRTGCHPVKHQIFANPEWTHSRPEWVCIYADAVELAPANMTIH